MTAGFEIRPEDPRHPAVLALLAVHLDTMAQQSPPESRHALDVTGLCGPAIAFRAAWQGETLAGIGALMALGQGESELKSMHTAAAFRGQGVARGMLAHLLALARSRGDRRVSLETGSQPGFAASRALYASAGFVECPPFAAYRPDPNSTFMTLAL